MIYIGQHQTEDLNDGYMGSGIRIVRAIEKYGVENFEKTILFECSSVEEMNAKEAEIVNEDFISRDDVYNIVVGGTGGWDYVNSKPNRHEHALKSGIATKKSYRELNERKRQGILSEYDEQRIQRRSNASKLAWNSLSDDEKILRCQKTSEGLKTFYKTHDSPMKGKTHSIDSKQKMSINHQGKKNSQYGKMWICNDKTHESRSIFKTDQIPEGWRKGKYRSTQTLEEYQLRQSLLEQILAINPTYSSISQHTSIKRLKKILNKYHEQIQTKNTLIEKLTEQYNFYKKFGWNAFVKKYNYQYTCANFLQMCKKYVKNYSSDK